MEIDKFTYLFISCNDQFQNQTDLFKRKCCLSVGSDKKINILSILPKISTIIVFKGSKMPGIPVTQIPFFVVDILHIVSRNIVYLSLILSTLPFLKKKAWF